jgi:hypothetical protein
VGAQDGALGEFSGHHAPEPGFDLETAEDMLVELVRGIERFTRAREDGLPISVREFRLWEHTFGSMARVARTCGRQVCQTSPEDLNGWRGFSNLYDPGAHG